MKGILIVDMPSNCRECPFYDDTEIPSCWANMDFKARTIIYDKTEIQDFCPLKPIPQMPYWLQFEECDGWRECIKAITGDEE